MRERVSPQRRLGMNEPWMRSDPAATSPHRSTPVALLTIGWRSRWLRRPVLGWRRQAGRVPLPPPQRVALVVVFSLCWATSRAIGRVRLASVVAAAEVCRPHHFPPALPLPPLLPPRPPRPLPQPQPAVLLHLRCELVPPAAAAAVCSLASPVRLLPSARTRPAAPPASTSPPRPASPPGCRSSPPARASPRASARSAHPAPHCAAPRRCTSPQAAPPPPSTKGCR